MEGKGKPIVRIYALRRSGIFFCVKPCERGTIVKHTASVPFLVGS